jgi:hypothetical protein
MNSIRSNIASLLNGLANPFGAVVVPSWQWDYYVDKSCRTFFISGRPFPFFLHHHNCGHEPSAATERTVELAVADYWLGKKPFLDIIEIGAVTPYYWPGRIPRVVDPADPHPRVTDRAPMNDIDLSNKSVLCISTLEHIGSGEYGLPHDPTAMKNALNKIVAEAESFLISVPVGYSPMSDAILFDAPQINGINYYCVARSKYPPYWDAVKGVGKRCKYGTIGLMADAVVFLEKGGILEASSVQHHPFCNAPTL